MKTPLNSLFSTFYLVPLASLFLSGCGDKETNATQSLTDKDYIVSIDDYLTAARAGDLESIKLFHNAGIDVDAQAGNGDTALIRAASAGQLETVEALLKAGADPRLASADARTALISAADSGYTDVGRLLLERGADISAQDAQGWNALNVAAFNGHAEMVEMLAGKIDQESLDGALLVASFNGDPAVIDQLLNHGAYVNTRSPANQTPLMIAAQNGHTDAVNLLLQHQANPFALDDNENTAANLADAKGHPDLRDLLLDPTASQISGSLDSDPANATAAAEATAVAEAEVAQALDALDGGTGELVDAVLENGAPPMAALNGAVLKDEHGAESLKFDSYREKPLPVMLKGVKNDSAEVRVLSSATSEPVTVHTGEIIPNTNLKITNVSTKFVNSKQGKGKPVDVSRITVEDTSTGAKHMLVKDVPGRAADTYAVLTMPGSSYRYVVKSGDVFRAVTPDDDEQDYQVMEIRPTQVIIKNISSEEILTINRGGIAMR